MRRIEMKTKIELDKAGFPMVWVESVSSYVHWIPVTKIQFEIFMCDLPNKDFNDSWYRELLSLNKRISPKNITKKDYWQLFITGIKPSEAESYANWCASDGNEYKIPTLEEWNDIYKSLKEQPISKDLFSKIKLSTRTELLISKLDGIVQSLYKTAGVSYSLADQMLMRYGVMEWVQHESRRQDWAGMGQTDAGLQSMLRTADSGTPETPKNVNENRFHYYGFRLLRR